MANITITIADALIPRTLAALRAKVNIPGGAQMSDLAFGKACIIRLLTQVVRDYEQELALAQAASAVSDVPMT
jgi:hypothetical protein